MVAADRRERLSKESEILMTTDAIKKKIRAIVGPDYCLDSDLDRFGYSYDSSFVALVPANKPDLVVRPLGTVRVRG